MSVVEESGDDVMLSDASPASPGQGLGSPIATALINIGVSGTWIFCAFQTFTFTRLTSISPHDL